MKRVALTALALVAMTSVVFAVGASAHRIKFDTALTAKFNKPKKNDPYATAGSFDGAVSSPKLRCEANRRINLRLRAADGSSTVVGTILSSANGDWSIQPSAVAPGTYFAQTSKKVLRKSSKHRHTCKKDVSKDVTVK